MTAAAHACMDSQHNKDDKQKNSPFPYQRDYEQLQADAKAFAKTVAAKPLKLGYKPFGLYCYTDAAGQPLYWKVRAQHNTFYNLTVPEQQRIANGASANAHKWIRAISVKPDSTDSRGFQLKEPDFSVVYPAGAGKKPLYNLAGIASAAPDTVVWLFEGEQKADLANMLGLLASTCGGASSIEGTCLTALAGRDVVIWPDNDEPGIKARDCLVTALQQLGCSVSCVDVDALGLPHKGDIVDWLALQQAASKSIDKQDIEAIPRIVMDVGLSAATNASTKLAEQEASQQDESEDIKGHIEALARLSPVAYEQCRQSEAKRLGMRAGVLDKFVNTARKALEAADHTDDMFSPVAAWPVPVDGAALFNRIRTVIDCHIVCEACTTTAAALWIMFSWCIDAVQIAPIACITAPEKRCGKTQLLTLIGELCYRPMPVSNITAAALFRSIEKWQPSLLIDEADSFIKENEDLRGIINAGHSRKNAYVIRTTGDNHEPTRFNVWGAKAISGIGHLPETLKDRSIILELRRKQPHEARQRLRHADPLEFEQIRQQLARWSQDNFDQIKQARPELPDALNDRAQDNWESLLAIADLLGDEWAKKARHAAMSISGIEQNTPSINEELLGDIKAVFDRTGQSRMFTDDLLAYLCADDELSWATWNRGKPISPRQLAARLRDFGIESKNVRIGSAQRKGYDLTDFKDAFNRYLSNYLSNPVTVSRPTSHANDSNAYSDITHVPSATGGTQQKNLETLQHKHCNAGTDKNTSVAALAENQHVQPVSSNRVIL